MFLYVYILPIYIANICRIGRGLVAKNLYCNVSKVFISQSSIIIVLEVLLILI